MAEAITRIDITATDSTGTAISSVLGGLGKVQTSAESVQGAFVRMAATLGIGLSARSIISFGTELEHTADRIGLTITELEKLSVVAALNGTSVEALAKSFKGMSQSVVEAQDNTSKMGKLFSALGIDMKRAMSDPMVGFQLITEGLGKINNEVVRNAAGSAIFRRSYVEIAAAAKNFARDQEVANEVTKNYGTVAGGATKAAHELEVQVIALGEGSKRALLQAFAPALAAVAVALEMVNQQGGDFEKTWGGAVSALIKYLVEGFSFLAAGVAQWGFAMAGVAASIATRSLGPLKEAVADMRKTGEQAWQTIGKIEEAYKAAQAASASNAKTGEQSATALDKQTEAAKRFADVIARILAGGGEGGKKMPVDKTTQEWAKGAAEAAKAALEMMKQIQGLTAEEKRYQDGLEVIAELSRHSFNPEFVAALAQAWEKLNPAVVDAKNFLQAAIKELDAGTQQIVDATKAEKQHADTLGMSTQQLADYTVAAAKAAIADLELSLASQGVTDPRYEAAVNRRIEALNRYIVAVQNAAGKTVAFEANKDAQHAAQAAAREFEKAAEDIDHAMADMFDHAIFDKGRSAFEDLANFARQLFKKLVLQPLLQPVASALTSGVNSLLGGGSGGGFSFNPLSLFGSAGSNFAIGASGDAYMPALANASGGAPFAAMLGQAIGPALPWIAGGIAIASMLGVFDKKPSEVKGQFGISAGTTGFEDSVYTATKFGNLGFIDANTQQFSGQAAQVFNKIVKSALDAFDARMSPAQSKRLAGILQTMTFETMEGTFNTEDFLAKYGGKALQQVVAAAFDVLDPALASVARAFTGTAEEVADYANALLQFEDVSKRLPTIIKTQLIGAFDGTIETANKITAFATAYSTLVDVMNSNPMDDALNATAVAADSAYHSIGLQRQALMDLADAYTGTVDQSNALTTATKQYYNALVSELATIEQMKKTIAQSGQDTIRSFRLQSMLKRTVDPQTGEVTYSPDTGAQYAFYQAEIARSERQMSLAKDPAEVERLHNLILSDFREMFALVPDANKAALLPQFIEAIDHADALANERLTKLGDSLQKEFDKAMSRLQKIFDDFAGDMTRAGNTQQSAADTNLTAARTPRTIVVVDSSGREVGTY